MQKASIEQVIRQHLTDNIREPDVVDALMLMHGWKDGGEHGPANVAKKIGVDVQLLRQYSDLAELGLAGKHNPALNKALGYLESHLPLPHEEIGYHLQCELGVLDNSHFGVVSLVNAAAAYGIQPGFQSVSRNLHKWLVNPSDRSIVDYADQWIGDMVKQVERDCIVHFAQIERFLSRLKSEYSLQQLWQVIHACPRLSTGTFPYIFAREPSREQPLVKRIDRLLSWCNPHSLPVDLVFGQVFRDQSRIDIVEDSGVGIDRKQAFTGFLIQCSFYDVDLEGVSFYKQVEMDKVLGDVEGRVVEHLGAEVDGIAIEDVEEFARSIRCSQFEVQRALHTSPLIVTVDDSTFRVLDRVQIAEGPSPWDDSNRFPFWQVNIPASPHVTEEPVLLTTPAHSERLKDQLARHDAVIDLAELTWETWIGILPGELTEGLLRELEENNQRWTPLIDPGSRRCVGVVRTSRLRNKLRFGNKNIDLTDAKIQGVEVNRYVGRQELNEAFTQSFCVFFNDGPDRWDVVFPRHLRT